MRSLTLVAMLIPLLCLVGCTKRTAKKDEPSRDESASVKPQPQPQPKQVVVADKNKKDDGPNWLTDPRWQKEQPKGPQDDEPVAGKNKQPWGFTPPKEGWQGPKTGIPPVQPVGPGGMPPVGPGPAPGPGVQPVVPAPGNPNPPGMGKLDPQPQPANPVTQPKFSPVAEADMKEVWIFIENASGASGKMPAEATTFQALIAAKSPAADLVKNGSITLTGSSARESIWAFETKALFQGGLVASQNGVETLTADELKSRLGK